MREGANSSIEESGGSTRESRTKVCRGRCAVIVKCKRGGVMRVGGGADAAAEARRGEGRIRFGGGARTDLYCYLCRVSQ